MTEHEHATGNQPDKAPKDEVAKKASAIYVKKGRPQGHAVQNGLEAEARLGADHKTPHAGPNHHAHMAADFQRRFWIALALTLPILALSPMLQSLVGLREAIRFPGDMYVLFGLSSAVFWYGGGPFLTRFFSVTG